MTEKNTIYEGAVMSKTEKYSFENTVLLLSDNDDLKTRLMRLSSSLDFKIFLADPNKPDILAVPYFAAVIDEKYFQQAEKKLNLDIINGSEIIYTDRNTPDEIIRKIKLIIATG